MTKYSLKPATVDAWQYHNKMGSLPEWITEAMSQDNLKYIYANSDDYSGPYWEVKTSQGWVKLESDHWLVKGPDGFRVYDFHTFYKMYSPLPEATPTKE